MRKKYIYKYIIFFHILTKIYKSYSKMTLAFFCKSQSLSAYKMFMQYFAK